MERRAKIVATIGPASQHRETLRELLIAGMDVARLNFSHGAHEHHHHVVHILRDLATELDLPISIMQDIQGPKIRTGEMEGGKVELKKGEILTLTTQGVICTSELVSVDFNGLPNYVQPGSRILIDDGNLELKVLEVKPKGETHLIKTEVVLGGTLKSHKGVNLPGVKLDIPALTRKDVEDLAFGLELGIDAVAMSFVRSANDLNLMNQMISLHGGARRPPIVIAKLERPEALDNLEAIVDAADGVMVARGDLGVEMTPEAVPIAQKRIIELANLKGKLVITATQMLESMIQSPRPTRAEASDVANAIFDGTDAVMLSGETAVGKYPVQAVRMMSDIVQRAEEHISQWGRWKGLPEPGECDDDTFFMTMAATELARDRNVAALAAFTESGRTAQILSKERPVAPILACTSNEETYRRLNLYWGVRPIRVQQVSSIAEMLKEVEQALVARRRLKKRAAGSFHFWISHPEGPPDEYGLFAYHRGRLGKCECRKMKTIGLIGGMSWESSLEYYRIVNETVKEKLGGLHSAKCALFSVDFAEIEAMQNEGRWTEAGQRLAAAAQSLEKAGSDFVALCTNTMHKLAPQIEASITIPFLHIADATADKIKAAGIRRVGLLGTRFTMEQDFYKGRLIQKHGLEVIVPQAEDREIVHRVIYEELVLGQIRPESRQQYRQIMHELVQAGAQGIILGCTEIGLLVKPEDSSLPLFDTTRIHAEAVVDFALME